MLSADAVTKRLILAASISIIIAALIASKILHDSAHVEFKVHRFCSFNAAKNSGHHDFIVIGRAWSLQTCSCADNKEVGTWLNNILRKGGTEDWRKVLKDATGEDISTRAMMDYFKPLMAWLEQQNKGRQIGWD
jgi:hypothetical protein